MLRHARAHVSWSLQKQTCPASSTGVHATSQSRGGHAVPLSSPAHREAAAELMPKPASDCVPCPYVCLRTCTQVVEAGRPHQCPSCSHGAWIAATYRWAARFTENCCDLEGLPSPVSSSLQGQLKGLAIAARLAGASPSPEPFSSHPLSLLYGKH